MTICPDCSEPLDIEDEGLALGDVVVCDECGATLEVVDPDGPDIQPVLDSVDLEDNGYSEESTLNGFERKYQKLDDDY